MPSVFVSYSHDPANPEHSHNVLRLAASLMRDGLTVFIDQNRGDDEEKIPWPIWMEDRIESADYVLLVCTELYWNKVRQKVPNDVGQGVCWEANLIYNALYENKLNTIKFVPVVFTDSERKFIPSPLKGATSFLLDSPLGYKRLFAFLTGQHRRRFPKPGRTTAHYRRGARRADVPAARHHRKPRSEWRREDEKNRCCASRKLCASGRSRPFHREPDGVPTADRPSFGDRF